MRKRFGIYLTILGFTCLLSLLGHIIYRQSDMRLRENVVQLIGSQGKCSGVYVKGDSGKTYILSAAHCAILQDAGKIQVIDSNNEISFVEILKQDTSKDLMLLTGIDKVKGLEIAAYDLPHEPISAITHGKGHSAYMERGELLEHAMVCLALETGLGCWEIVYTNLMVSPGSSGGAAVNSFNEVIGVVSVGDNVFGGLVPLTVIHQFMQNM